MKKAVRILSIVLILTMLVLCFASCMAKSFISGVSSVLSGGKEKGPDFLALYNDLDPEVKYAWSVGSDGSYLSADTNKYNSDDYFDIDVWYSIERMNRTLGLPDSLAQEMEKTTWSMGKQQETYTDAGVEVTWTYHPDKGMEVTYKLINN